MSTYPPSFPGAGLGRFLLLAGWLSSSLWAHAQPTIVSVVPTNMATGVSCTAPVVITFSEAMDTNVTAAQFMDETTLQLLSTSATWTAGDTVLPGRPAHCHG